MSVVSPANSPKSTRSVVYHRRYIASIALAVIGVLASFWLSDWYAQGAVASLAHFGGWVTAQFALLSVCMLAAWRYAPPSNTLRDVRWLLVIGVLIRLALIPLDHYTSNDMDRYLFDGKIALEGFDPYRLNHDNPELSLLKEQWSPPAEHTRYPTLYPPLSLALFTVAATAGAEQAPLAWKCLVTLAGVATLFVMAILLRERGALRHLPLVALSPILILESGIGAHVDAFSALFVAAALLAYQRRALGFTGVFIALGALVKLLPFALLLPLVLGQRTLRGALSLAGSAVAVFAAGYALTLATGLVPIGSIGTLFAKWRFGSPLFPLLESVLAPAQQMACIALLVVIGGLLISRQTWNLPRPIDAASPLLMASLCLILLLSPVIFPWYLMVLVPLVALNPQPFVLIWLCTLPFTYEVLSGFYADGVWEPSRWPLALVAVGFLAGVFLTRYLPARSGGNGNSRNQHAQLGAT